MKCCILIVGAGITGLAIANELVRQSFTDILVIEKEQGLGFHASGRNSGVLHSGIYYAPDSLKARFCLEGNRLLTDFCHENGLILRRCGKVIVSKDEASTEGILLLKERGDANGVKSEIIDADELKRIEPYAFTYRNALFTPETSVFDPHEVIGKLYSNLIGSGKVRFMFGTEFLGITGHYSVKTGRGEIVYQKLVNTAGSHADRIAHKFGIGMDYKILPFIGTYRKLKEDFTYLVNGNIYPVPDLRTPFLGVHFTKAANGDVFIGPTAIPAPGRESYEFLSGLSIETISILYRDLLLLFHSRGFRDNAIREAKKILGRYLYIEAKQMLPALEPEYISASGKSGIRPQLVDWNEKKLVDDFVVESTDNTVHVLNAISPAFTSSMSFARYVVSKFINST